MHSYLVGPEVIKLFSYSTQPSTKFILLINVKMPTTVGILTFISMINTTSERFKARNFFIFWYFSFNEQLKFRVQLSWAWKKFYNLGAWKCHNHRLRTNTHHCKDETQNKNSHTTSTQLKLKQPAPLPQRVDCENRMMGATINNEKTQNCLACIGGSSQRHTRGPDPPMNVSGQVRCSKL